MKIIISPAKQMRPLADFPEPQTVPAFLEQADTLRAYLSSLPYDELKTLLACNDALARQNYERFQTMNLQTDLLTHGNAAILSYDGIQYKYMAPQVFETEYFEYVQEHVRILSGFYGILRPLDGIVPYRLEMQAKLRTDFCRNLYDFWDSAICAELLRGENSPPILVNLASAEYSRAVERYLPQGTQYITCRFGELEDGMLREKGVYVKMARGEMVRYMAGNRISGENGSKLREALASFSRLDFCFSSRLSTETTLTFVKSIS